MTQPLSISRPVETYHNNLTPIEIVGSPVNKDFAFSTSVDDTVGYSVTVGEETLNVTSFLPPLNNEPKEIVIFNANLNTQNKDIVLHHDVSNGNSPSSLIFIPSGQVHVIREHESVMLMWTPDYNMWVMKELVR